MFDFFKGFGVTFSTMFKKVVTEEYPEDFPPPAPRYHGRHQLNRHPDMPGRRDLRGGRGQHRGGAVLAR